MSIHAGVERLAQPSSVTAIAINRNELPWTVRRSYDIRRQTTPVDCRVEYLYSRCFVNHGIFQNSDGEGLRMSSEAIVVACAGARVR
jgi:hypothetical protein